MASQVDKKLGREVAAYRASAGLTQEQLAEKVKVTPETISRLERGVTLPSLKTLERIAKALGIELRDLFDFRAGKKSKKEQQIDTLVRDLKRERPETVQLVREIADRVFHYLG